MQETASVPPCLVPCLCNDLALVQPRLVQKMAKQTQQTTVVCLVCILLMFACNIKILFLIIGMLSQLRCSKVTTTESASKIHRCKFQAVMLNGCVVCKYGSPICIFRGPSSSTSRRPTDERASWVLGNKTSLKDWGSYFSGIMGLAASTLQSNLCCSGSWTQHHRRCAQV